MFSSWISVLQIQSHMVVLVVVCLLQIGLEHVMQLIYNNKESIENFSHDVHARCVW